MSPLAYARKGAGSLPFLALLCALATPLAAQEPTDPQSILRATAARHAADCRQALEILSRHDRHPRMAWAVDTAAGCGALGGEALAHALRRQRGTHEPTAELETLVRRTYALVDASIFEAALEVATDPSAGRAARIQSFRILHAQLSPGDYMPYEGYLAATKGMEGPLGGGGVVGRPLPADAAERLGVVTARIRQDAAEHRDVRSAADVVWIISQIRLHCDRDGPVGPCMQRLLELDRAP